MNKLLQEFESKEVFYIYKYIRLKEMYHSSFCFV